ncbi:MAG: hypothetical protein EAZ85_13080 [Bacteroidetes bacterium]|nr:MAG: hypothetical protein EAZ85_13080 [Bacteroidota bacterium]TAG86280.1 MAG: hypothetical protein EAZ20_13145 [Bacteroidota bacterium]
MKEKRKYYQWHKTNHDEQKYGKTIAQNVAIYLEKGGTIAYAHRDYCGTGFIFEENTYYYCTISDGYAFYEKEAFATQKEFIEWLSKQSDRTMSMVDDENASDFDVDNQCITKERLLDLSAKIEPRDILHVIKKGQF